MPAYTFRCRVCGEVFTRRYGFHDDLSQVRCPAGHTDVERVLRPPAIVFKGSGFYITDHRRSNGGTSSSTKQKRPHAAATGKQSTTAAQAPA